MPSDWLLLAVLLLPLGGVPLAGLLAGSHQAADWLVLSLLEVEAVLALLLLGAVGGGHGVVVPLAAATVLGLNLEWRLSADTLAAAFILLGVLVSLLGAAYSLGKNDQSGSGYYRQPLSLLGLATAIGVFLSGNLLTLFAFWQLAILAAALVLVLPQRGPALVAAARFLTTSELGAVCLFAATAVVLGQNGGQTLTAWSGAGSADWRLPVLVLLTITAGTSAAVAPFHSWYGSAVATVSPSLLPTWLSWQSKLGLYLLLRLASGLSPASEPVWNDLLLALAALTILVAALSVLGEQSTRRVVGGVFLLQAGLILVGLGSGSAFGLAGGVFLVFSQTAAGMAVLLALAAVRDSVGADDPSLVGGLLKRQPLPALVFTVGALGMVGLPLAAGYPGLLLVYQGLATGGESWRLAFLALGLFGSAVTAAALLRLGGLLFLGERNRQQPFAEPLGLFPKIALGAVLVCCLAVGLLPRVLLEPIVAPSTGVVPLGTWADLALAPARGGTPVAFLSPLWALLLAVLPFLVVLLAARLERANPYPSLPAETPEVLKLAEALAPGAALPLAPQEAELRTVRQWRELRTQLADDGLDPYAVVATALSTLASIASRVVRFTFRFLLR
jgi:multicomponent Na+:H+ antiporter subunit D